MAVTWTALHQSTFSVSLIRDFEDWRLRSASNQVFGSLNEQQQFRCVLCSMVQRFSKIYKNLFSLISKASLKKIKIQVLGFKKNSIVLFITILLNLQWFLWKITVKSNQTPKSLFFSYVCFPFWFLFLRTQESLFLILMYTMQWACYTLSWMFAPVH